MDLWTEEGLLQLIELYKEHSVLWNPKDLNYFRKEKKIDAWKEIARLSLGHKSEESCKKKIVSLLASYRKERNKEKASQGTGKGKPLFNLFVEYMLSQYI